MFTYIWLIFMVNVGKYTSPMDPMGMELVTWIPPLQSVTKLKISATKTGVILVSIHGMHPIRYL